MTKTIAINPNHPLYELVEGIETIVSAKDSEIASLGAEIAALKAELAKATGKPEAPADDRIARMIYAAKFAMLLDIPYVFGAEYHNDKAFDCSSFTQALYKFAGSTIPRTTRTQIKTGRRVDFADIRPGDLIFYDTSGKKSQVNHVALYIGNREMIHTNSPRDGINVQNVDTGKHAKWTIEVRRILPESALEGYGN